MGPWKLFRFLSSSSFVVVIVILQLWFYSVYVLVHTRVEKLEVLFPVHASDHLNIPIMKFNLVITAQDNN